LKDTVLRRYALIGCKIWELR